MRTSSAPVSSARVPFLDVARSRRKMTEFLNEHVMPVAHPHQMVTRVKRQYTAYQPEGDCLVLYRVSLEEASDPRFVSVTFGERTRLRKAYEGWSKRGGYEPISPKAMAMRLLGHGFERTRSGRTRFWVGLTLIEDAEDAL